RRVPSGSLVGLGRMAQAGCAHSLDRLLREVEGPVYRYLVGRLRAAPDAEDLARDLCQETLIRAVASIPRSTFASDGRLLAWGLTIARNVLLDHLRQAHGRAEVRGEEHWARTEAGGLLPGEDAPPPRRLETLAAEALAEVPEATAELLRLRLVAGRSWKEVARELGIPESAAKRRFQRAQAALRRKILARMDASPPPHPAEGAAFRSPGGTPRQYVSRPPQDHSRRSTPWKEG
ncbi:MAG TPA: RNA polymerase sigma factor, partial [Longimicrobiaceae bacterium]|nr:RNA polymerase sigma factor [Longimicrobiaceae bacterium]